MTTENTDTHRPFAEGQLPGWSRCTQRAPEVEMTYR
jgi:hypothetical protein